MLYQIGEFSKIVKLSIKTLRYYHDAGILSPTKIDNFTGYRYYDENLIEKAQMILTLKDFDFSLKEITIDDILIASIRFKGKYNEIGKAFSKLGKLYGRYSLGTVFSLYYDGEYKEDNADIEACIKINKLINIKDIKSRILKGGKAISIIHKGSYELLGSTYKVIIDYMKNNNLELILPHREIYHKGPGVIFKGNPKNYITEIQFLIK